ncbi:MAG: hypothetical protein E4H20_00845 [Spirochaetales bacterium]|nr:MAG: hypothetical protein E4H20_00845 [Spirochaetales bacterium]
MTERGIVTKLEDSVATVGITMGEGCANCNSHGDCAMVGATIQADLPENIGVKVGDQVSIELPSGIQAAALAWLIILPLSLFFAGYAGGTVLSAGRGEGLSALLGILGIAMGLVAAVLASRRGRLGRRPKIVAVDQFPG